MARKLRGPLLLTCLALAQGASCFLSLCPFQLNKEASISLQVPGHGVGRPLALLCQVPQGVSPVHKYVFVSCFLKATSSEKLNGMSKVTQPVSAPLLLYALWLSLILQAFGKCTSNMNSLPFPHRPHHPRQRPGKLNLKDLRFHSNQVMDPRRSLREVQNNEEQARL